MSEPATTPALPRVLSLVQIQNSEVKKKDPKEKRIFFLWLRGLDSNQRPSGYTFPATFVAAWTISSSLPLALKDVGRFWEIIVRLTP